MTSGSASPQHQPLILLVNVAHHYKPAQNLHQRDALDWLQNQVSTAVLNEFVRYWHNPFRHNVPTLEESSWGEAVVILQQALNRWGANLTLDGVFGTCTKFEVLRFQRQRGLMIDGIVGSRTWNELFKSAHTIRLSELLRTYNPRMSEHHIAALEWLQEQISTIVLKEFARRWRNQVR